jgi:FkbM family methyltransferase
MTFEEAQDRVKIGHFTRKGYKIRGVVHVGANDGFEIQFYLALGAELVVAFEPLISASSKLFENYGSDVRVELFNCALGDHEYWQELTIAPGDGQGSTFLPEVTQSFKAAGTQSTLVRRFDSMGIDIAPCNTLVVDTQGMELQVLKGFGEQLAHFDFLNIECSRVPLYVGGAPAQEVIDYLAEQGFDQDTPIVDHDDIMFVRRGVKP